MGSHHARYCRLDLHRRLSFHGPRMGDRRADFGSPCGNRLVDGNAGKAEEVAGTLPTICLVYPIESISLHPPG